MSRQQLKLICKVSGLILENHNRDLNNFREKEDKLEDKRWFQTLQWLDYHQLLNLTALLPTGMQCQFKSYLQRYNNIIIVHNILLTFHNLKLLK